VSVRDRCGRWAGLLCACKGGAGAMRAHPPSRSTSLCMSSREQRQVKVDPEGLEVQGQG